MISKFNLFQMVMVCAILSSCTAEDSLVQYPNEVPVSDALNCQLSLQMPQSRTKDNIAGFYNLYYAVYEKMSGELVLSNADEPKKLEGSDKWQDVEIPVEMYDGKVYEVALWAHPENSRFADVSDLRQISIDYNQDNPIAFTTHFTVTAARTAISNLVLKIHSQKYGSVRVERMPKRHATPIMISPKLRQHSCWTQSAPATMR